MNELDEDVKEFDLTFKSIREDIERLNNEPGSDTEEAGKLIQLKIDNAAGAHKMFQKTLRKLSGKTDEFDVKIMPEHKADEYTAKQKGWYVELEVLRKALKEAKAGNTDRAALFGEKKPEKAKEEMNATELWADTNATQDRTIAKGEKALQLAEEGKASAIEALEKVEENMEKEKRIIREAQDLEAQYKISFGLMFKIMKGLACDGCFQMLMGLLVLAIVVMLVLNFTL